MEQQSSLDHGVQIRFITDLQEPRRPPRPRGKAGSYGVAVRVQGIAGQPFVVLNSGDKGSDSFGVQIKSNGSFASPPAGPQPAGSDLDLPENPYGERPARRGSAHGSSDEEGTPRDLRRSQSHGDLLRATTEEPVATGAPHTIRHNRAPAVGKSSGLANIAPERGEASRATIPSPDTGGGDVDTEPLGSVDSLISKFDGPGPARGRVARRGRVPPEQRKRSQSLDGRGQRRDVPDTGGLSGTQRRAGSVRPTGSPEDTGTRSQRGTRGAEEPPAERLQLKSTPDLLRDQREVTQPGGTENPQELIYGILREGSSESEMSLKRKTLRLLEKLQELAVSPKATTCPQPQHRDLARRVEELQEKLDEETKLRQKLELPGEPAKLREAEGENRRLRTALETKSQELQRRMQELSAVTAAKDQAETRLRQHQEQLLETQRELDRLRQDPGAAPDGDAAHKELAEAREELEELRGRQLRLEEQLRLRERELTALKGALKEEVAAHDRELDRVRQQCQSDVETLRRSMEDISQDQASLESERQRISTVLRNLQRELEESTEETGHWRDLFQKNKDELRAAKQELLQVKLEREELEDELRELRERLAAARQETERARGSAGDPGELDALRKELREAREQQRELAEQRQSRDEQLRQREQELAALRDEASGRAEELERLRRDLQQLREERDEASEAKASLESARAAAEQARGAAERGRRELQEQNDDLRRKIQGLEEQLKDYERLGESWEGSQARLKDKVAKLEAERRQLEESLGEAGERERELLAARRQREEAERALARLAQEQQELRAAVQDERRHKEQLQRSRDELEEQKRLLDRTTQKLNKELEQMSQESQHSLAALRAQLDEFRDKSRKELADVQKQAQDRGAELESARLGTGRLQDEVARLKQALQEQQAQRDSAQLDKELLLQRLQGLEQELEKRQRGQDERSRHARAMEEKAKQLEEELEEERATVELLTERVTRGRDQLDQLRAELLQERSGRQDLECDKVSLERQNKELKSRLASAEGLQRPSGHVPQLEARVQELQERLQAEEREKSALLSSNRKLERKVKELSIQIEDERQHVSDQKDQLSLRVKALKRQVDEAEEEIERLEGARKKAQRELEEQQELNEQLQTRVTALEKEAWRKAARSAADSSLRDQQLSSDEESDSAYGPSSIASLLNEPTLQTSSC